MARINQKLLERLEEKLGVTRRQIYNLIDAKVRTAHLPRPLAAIALAGERGINISKFAKDADFAAIQRSSGNAVPAPVIVPQMATSSKNAGKNKPKARRTVQQRRGTTVFVVHGRNRAARDAVFDFLRSIGLRPLEWTQALKLTKKGSPYVGEILDAAFGEAAAIIVLLLLPMMKHDCSAPSFYRATQNTRSSSLVRLDRTFCLKRVWRLEKTLTQLFLCNLVISGHLVMSGADTCSISTTLPISVRSL